MSNFVLTNPEAPITVDQRSTLVKLIDSKVFDLDGIVTGHDGEAVVFEDDSPVTFGDLAFNEPRTEGSGRHFPVICGLTKGQASGAIAELISFADKPKANNAGRPKAASRQVKAPAQPAKPVETSLKDELRSMITDIVGGMLGDMLPKAEPAKPEPAADHVKVAKPAKPVVVKALTVEDGSVLEIAGDHFVVSIGKNGRPYLAKAEA